ncbi:MAG: histidinol-phosphate transaminase [Candidatus Altiarchaeota archaeon]
MDHMKHMKEWVKYLAPYSPGKTVDGTIKLSSNENNYGPSPNVIAGLKKSAHKVFMYPYKDEEVKAALAKYCGAKPGNIVLGNGSDELIELIVKVFHGPIGSHYPTFAEYPTYAKMHDIPYVSSNLGAGFAFEAGRFLRETKDARILFLCTPNNPTGTIISRYDVEKVAATGKIVVVDEAYAEFWGVTYADLPSKCPNVIVLKTLAKAFGLAGLRIGYAIAAPDVADALARVKAPFNVNYVAHEAALLALKDLPYMRRTVKKLVKDREVVAKSIAKRFKVIPSETNFLLVDVSPMSPGEFFDRMLKEKIVVRPQPRFEGFPGNWVRITIGTSAQNRKLMKAVDRI